MSPEIFTVVMFGGMIFMVICGFGVLAAWEVYVKILTR